MALPQTILEHVNQLGAASQDDLIEKDFEPLLLEHVIQIHYPDAVDRLYERKTFHFSPGPSGRGFGASLSHS